jgi:hypothetical protein
MIEIASTSPDGPRVPASVALCSKNCGRFRGGRRWREHAWVPSGGCVRGWTRWEELYALGKYHNCPPDSERAEKWPEQKCRRRFPFDSGTQVGSQPGVSRLESWSRRLAAISYLHGWCDDRRFRYTVFQKKSDGPQRAFYVCDTRTAACPARAQVAGMPKKQKSAGAASPTTPAQERAASPPPSPDSAMWPCRLARATFFFSFL